jgi:predicted nucleic acid-binding protein
MPTLPVPQVVIDAGAAVGALLPTIASVDTLERFVKWRQAGASIVAPPLLLAECTSVIRRYVFNQLLTAGEAAVAIADLAALDVTIVPDTPARCRAASDWAVQLGQMRAYDGFYLALAQALAAPLYTGDKRLANGARQLGIDWVIWVGEG